MTWCRRPGLNRRPRPYQDASRTSFKQANQALEAVPRIIRAQVPGKRVELARRVTEELALEHLVAANGTASLTAMNLADGILAVARPSANALQSSLGPIAHDEPEARASLRDQ